jgi:hypothetical protein
LPADKPVDDEVETSDERLRVASVPRNIGDEMKFMGTPLKELVLLFGVPLLIWTLLRSSRLDTLIPFAAPVGAIWLSSFVLWICGPLLALFFVAYKRAHPNYDLVGNLLYVMFPKNYHTGRDVEYRPYLLDPLPKRRDDDHLETKEFNEIG